MVVTRDRESVVRRYVRPNSSTVLQGEQWPAPSTNPYIPLLYRSITDAGVRLQSFSWWRALFGTWRILHIHWPEFLVRKSTRTKTMAARLLVRLLILRISVTGRTVVWTVHNPEPHERLDKRASALLAKVLRRVNHEIHLSAATMGETGSSVEKTVIPHGDYIEWFGVGSEPAQPGRLLCFGQLRPYKQLESLIESYEGAGIGDAVLRIIGAGRASYVEHLVGLSSERPGITVVGRYFDDHELCTEVLASEIIVLPYPITNSGALLLALSLQRPVITIDTPSTREMQDEVGPGWLHLVPRQMTPDALEAGVAIVRSSQRSSRPDLSRRRWNVIGPMHARLYAQLESENRS